MKIVAGGSSNLAHCLLLTKTLWIYAGMDTDISGVWVSCLFPRSESEQFVRRNGVHIGGFRSPTFSR